MTFIQKCYSKEKIEMEFTIIFLILGAVFLTTAVMLIISATMDGWEDRIKIVSACSALVFGMLFILAAIGNNEQEVENKNTEEKYNTCVDAGYDVYIDDQEIDASKIIFEPDEYKVKFDDKKKEVILQEKSLR